MKLNQIADNAGRAQESHARRARHRLRHGQDRRPRRQGPDRALRRRASRASKAARCRCTGACRSAASATPRSRSSSTEINLGKVQAAIDAGLHRCRQSDRRRGHGEGRADAARQGRRQLLGNGEFKAKASFSVYRRLAVGDRGGREGRRLGENPGRAQGGLDDEPKGKNKRMALAAAKGDGKGGKGEGKAKAKPADRRGCDRVTRLYTGL